MTLTRRNLLGVAAASVLGACRKPPPPPSYDRVLLDEFQPKSMLTVAQHPVERAAFPVIDVHTHVSSLFGTEGAPPATGPSATAMTRLDQVLHDMDQLNLRTLVNLTGRMGDELKRNIDLLAKAHAGRFLVCTEPTYEHFENPDYSQWQADELQRARLVGAVGLKILKYLGLGLREKLKGGRLVSIDDPRFDLMWEAAGALRMPVFIHTADPDAFFTPIDRFNERWEELGHHPEWSFYGKDYPSKKLLLEARNHVLARHPETTFVGLHVANHPENLDEVSEWLIKYPNLNCEIGARIGELGRQPRRARRFFDQFQDRILFGSDAVPGVPAMVSQDLTPALYYNYFRFLESEDEYFDYAPTITPPQGRWKISGLGLPKEILKKVYHNNAARILRLNAI